MKTKDNYEEKKVSDIIPAYMCSVCGYLYDTESAQRDLENKIVPFQDLPTDFLCPNCGVRRELFVPVYSDRTPDIIKK
ncbi:MAG: rubredoxin [bacterium]